MSTLAAKTAVLLLAIVSTQVAAEETITLSGRFEYRTDPISLDIIGRQVCFFPTEHSAHLVPRPRGDNRLPWFCFSNSAAAAKMLGFRLTVSTDACGVSGSATLTVSHYVAYPEEGDGNDVATLNFVQKKTKPEPIPCEIDALLNRKLHDRGS
ncbi:hypothetical protein [Pseudomethylobacillus aquaticus]|nr:hypothetical protein [Pseudomethylobacillus aquaticus]